MCCAHRFGEFHIFERNLTKATTASPCAGFGFTAYDKTETHGFGPVSMTLDLYNKPSLGAAAVQPCCEGTCTAAGQAKYYSIAKDLGGQTHCGECCMDPSKYTSVPARTRVLPPAACLRAYCMPYAWLPAL